MLSKDAKYKIKIVLIIIINIAAVFAIDYVFGKSSQLMFVCGEMFSMILASAIIRAQDKYDEN